MADEDTADPLMFPETRIKHCLEIYPMVSPSMLQVGLGTNIAPAVWRPVLQSLIDRGIVCTQEHECKTTSGRNFFYTRIALKENAHLMYD